MVDLDLNNIPTVSLKTVLAVHFVLITWGIQGVWSPDSYLFYNLIFVVSLLWALHSKEAEEPLQIAMAVDMFSFFADIFIITGFFPTWDSFSERFSVIMAILNFVFRPISVVLIGKVCAERMGLNNNGFPVGFGNLFGHPQADRREPYEDIESAQPHQSFPRNDTGLPPTYQ